MAYFVYIVECKDKTLYTGWTIDIEERIAKHNEGKGAKYTRGRHPVVLRYFEELPTKAKAMQREWEIKQLSRGKKLELIDRKAR
ncbi:MAG: GIY-YIG nuclease family protein [Clostridia bacterium]|jgi:putative endonuclease|nr:GIY-YIG nuclease family protein [Clostridia bacterium]